MSGEDLTQQGACTVLYGAGSANVESRVDRTCVGERGRWIMDGMESLLNGWNLTGPKRQHDTEDNGRGSSVAESNHPLHVPLPAAPIPVHNPSSNQERLVQTHTLLSGCSDKPEPKKGLV